MSLYQTGVRQLIDDFLIAESEKVRDYGDYWSASSAGYCMRKQIFQRLGVPPVEDKDPRLQRVFTSGHIFHEWIQGLTKQAGVSVAQETELIDEQLMVKGHFDDLIKTKEGLILYDYKTVNSRAFGYKKDEPSHYHKMQVGTYIYMLRKLNVKKLLDIGFTNDDIDGVPSNLTDGRILLISKDDLRMKEQEVRWTPELAKAVHGYWSTLNGYWKKQTIPSCTCADFEGGFLAKKQYNDYYYNGEPCSLEWHEMMKKAGKLK
jgi:hypothetical protein